MVEGNKNATGEDQVFDLITSKLARPRVRSGAVGRDSVLERLARVEPHGIVSVVAPAGYGKTTLMTQWADRDDRPFAWLSVDEQDNDPKALLTYIAEALNRVEPIPQRLVDALGAGSSSVLGTAVPRLGAAFAAMTTPVVLVLDDVHLLVDTECRAALSLLADQVPEGSVLALVGRTPPPVRIARLRAEGRLVEFGIDDLTLSAEEAALLLRGADIELDDEGVADLYQRAEGWPVALYLAALAVREGGSAGSLTDRFTGADRFVREYVESEFLARIPPEQRVFLIRAAALDRMSAPLCDAVLGLEGAAATLAVLARSNLLLVPLDHREQWYRYHHLFRDLLRAELVRTEPEMLPELRQRAAAWYLDHNMPDEAMEYAMLAEDVETVARLLTMQWSPTYRQGRIATLQRWFAWLDDRGGIDKYPLNAMNAAFLAMTTGYPATAERWATAVEFWRTDADRPAFDDYTQGMAAVLRAMVCKHGTEEMREDADASARFFARVSFAPSITPLLQGTARELVGDFEEADLFFAIADENPGQAPDIRAITLTERALIAISRQDWRAAETFIDRARLALVDHGIEESYGAALTSAVRARVLQHRGDLGTARRELSTALRLRPVLTYALPHRSLQCRLALIRVELALDDASGARTLMREIDDILRHRPHMGILVDEAEELRGRIAALHDAGIGGATSLTAAELRVLPLLATHLSYSEIASELYVSKNTVKTQAYSLFRKLDVTSRSEAVARSRELALLEG